MVSSMGVCFLVGDILTCGIVFRIGFRKGYLPMTLNTFIGLVRIIFWNADNFELVVLTDTKPSVTKHHLWCVAFTVSKDRKPYSLCIMGVIFVIRLFRSPKVLYPNVKRSIVHLSCAWSILKDERIRLYIYLQCISTVVLDGELYYIVICTIGDSGWWIFVSTHILCDVFHLNLHHLRVVISILRLLCPNLYNRSEEVSNRTFRNSERSEGRFFLYLLGVSAHYETESRYSGNFFTSGQ